MSRERTYARLQLPEKSPEREEEEVYEGHLMAPPPFALNTADDPPADDPGEEGAGPDSQQSGSAPPPPADNSGSPSPGPKPKDAVAGKEGQMPVKAPPPPVLKADSEPLPVTDLKAPRFEPAEAVANAIGAAGGKGLDIPVTFGDLASGTIRVMRDGSGHYRTMRRKFCRLPLNHAALSPLTALGVEVVLIIELQETGVVGGFVTLYAGGKVFEREAIGDWIAKNGQEMGWEGIGSFGPPATITNAIEGGRINFMMEGIPAKLGEFAELTLDYGFVNEQITFLAKGELDIPKVGKGRLEIARDKQGLLSGGAEMPVEFGPFVGAVKAEYKRAT